MADTYQGEEITQNSLVDPDNRRPVDYEALASMLADLDTQEALPAGATLDQKNYGSPPASSGFAASAPHTFASRAAQDSSRCRSPPGTPTRSL